MRAKGRGQSQRLEFAEVKNSQGPEKWMEQQTKTNVQSWECERKKEITGPKWSHLC